jgi:hypothetical protein
MVLSESSVSRKSDYDALLGFVFGALIGLSCLLFLEWLGRLSPFGNTDWTLIVAWKKSWEERNYLKGVLLTVAMGWWWFIVGAALVLLCLTPLILASDASLGYAGRGLFGRSRCILCGSYPAERVARVCCLCDDGRCFNCGDPFPIYAHKSCPPDFLAQVIHSVEPTSQELARAKVSANYCLVTLPQCLHSCDKLMAHENGR